LTLLEGRHLVAEAIRTHQRLETVFVTAAGPPLPVSDHWIEIVEVTGPVMERLAGTVSPPGPVAVMKIPEAAPPTTHPTVVLCAVADPGNAGTLIRTAAAFGYHVVFAEGSVDPWSPKVLRAGAGGHFHTAISVIDRDPIAQLDAADLTSIALVSHGGAVLAAPVEGVPAVLVGSEAHGLSTAMVEAAGHRVTIVTKPVTESLNAAVAGAIAMHRYATR